MTKSITQNNQKGWGFLLFFVGYVFSVAIYPLLVNLIFFQTEFQVGALITLSLLGSLSVCLSIPMIEKHAGRNKEFPVKLARKVLFLLATSIVAIPLFGLKTLCLCVIICFLTDMVSCLIRQIKYKSN